jgi:hypothetical protein
MAHFGPQKGTFSKKATFSENRPKSDPKIPEIFGGFGPQNRGGRFLSRNPPKISGNFGRYKKSTCYVCAVFDQKGPFLAQKGVPKSPKFSEDLGSIFGSVLKTEGFGTPKRAQKGPKNDPFWQFYEKGPKWPKKGLKRLKRGYLGQNGQNTPYLGLNGYSLPLNSLYRRFYPIWP